MIEHKIKVKDARVEQYQITEYALIEPKALIHIPEFEEGDLFVLEDSRNRFLGKGYFGKQNKGIGWLLTNKAEVSIDQSFFNDKLLEAFDNRDMYFSSQETTAFRVFNGEGDGIGGLTMDYYDGFLVITWYSEGIYCYKEMILKALDNFELKGIYQKKRFGPKGQYIDETSYLSGMKAPEPLIIKENQVQYATYLEDGPMTGIFLDQKEVRRQIKDHYAKGNRILNTFSYTGAFSVAAKKGGAIHTTSVDLAKRSLERTKEQFELNGIDSSLEDIVVMDVFDYFKWAIKKHKVFDLVILDPPAFAKSKKLTFSVTKDYGKLIEQAIEITTESGIIIASTNSANYELDRFMKDIHLAFLAKGIGYEILETYRLPGDFQYMMVDPKSNYLKVVIIQKRVSLDYS